MNYPALGALILWTEELEKCIEFYEVLGVKFEIEEHEDGFRHYAATLEGLHFAIFEGERSTPLPERRKSGSSQIGFKVENVLDIYETLKNLGAEVIWEPDEFPWGLAAMVKDPDGRPIEFFEPLS